MTFWDGYMIVGVQFGLGVALSSLTEGQGMGFWYNAKWVILSIVFGTIAWPVLVGGMLADASTDK
jgi:uncharacterized membrane protein (DUF441 family)